MKPRSSYVALILASILVTILLGGCGESTTDEIAASQLQVGVGSALITPTPDLFAPDIDGFTSVHDGLYTKVLVVQNDSTSMALVVLDLTSLRPNTVEDMKTVISEAANVPEENVFLTCTHDFSSPHDPGDASVTPDGYSSLLIDTTKTAATAASNSLQPAKVGYGDGTCDINVNRNMRTNEGYFLGTNEELPSNPYVGVTRFDDLEGDPIAVIVNYDCQSCVMQNSIMDDGSKPISSDLAGTVTKHVEDAYGEGCIAFWLIGAGSDQFPIERASRYALDEDGNWFYAYPDSSLQDERFLSMNGLPADYYDLHHDETLDVHDAGFTLLDEQGKTLGAEVVRVSDSIDTAAEAIVRTLTDTITVQTKAKAHAVHPISMADWSENPTGEKEALIYIWQIGEAAFVGTPPELSTTTITQVRDDSPFAYTFVSEMFDGGDYNMPAIWDYENFTYPARDSTYWPGSAEAWSEQVANDLQDIWQGRSAE